MPYVLRPGTSSWVSTARTPGTASAGDDVDPADARPRMRAAQRRAPQHPVGPQVRRVGELALDLRDAVRPPDRRRRPRPDLGDRAHVRPPTSAQVGGDRSPRRRCAARRPRPRPRRRRSRSRRAAGPEHDAADRIVDPREAESSSRHSTTSASSPTSACRARRRGRGTARRAACRAPAPPAADSAAARRAAARPAAPDAARRRARRPRWTPRRRPRDRPARRRRSSGTTGAIPAPSRAFDVGQCATPVPVAPKRATRARPGGRSGRATRRRRASRAPRGTRPAARRTARGRTPPPRPSRPCACAAARRAARANSAVSAISSRVTQNGEHGASAIRHIAPGDGSWKRVERLLVGREDRVAVLDDAVRRQPALGHAEVHRAAARVEADAELPRGVDLGRQQIAGAAREHVVVVGRGRAARPQQRREPGARRGALDPRVHARPHRIQLDEPLEQRRLLRQPAGRVLVEVVMAVDEARASRASRRVDLRCPRRPGPGRGRPP